MTSIATVKGKALKGGYITVLHTHGRNGQYHPHLHVMATSGGYDAHGERWEHLAVLALRAAASQVAVARAEHAAPDARRRRPSSRWWMRVSGSIPTAW